MISEKIKTRLSDPDLLLARNRQMARLENIFKGKLPDRPFVLMGVNGGGKCDLYSRPEQWIGEALEDLASKAELVRNADVFKPLSVNPWPYGVHFIDKLFGAEVFELDGEPGNWQVRTMPPEFGRLRMPDIDSHTAWQISRRAADAFLEAGVPLPFFAPPVLSSPINILLNLFGQEALVGMFTDPEAILKDLRVITDLIKSLHSWFIGKIPYAQLQMVEVCGRIQPSGHGQICGCSTQLLSPELYRDFIAPLDEEIFSLYPGGGMIHLCGAHSQLIPVWREMHNLTALQLNDRAAEDFELYFSGLRDDQILYANPCAKMLPQKIMEISGGIRTVIVQDKPLNVK